MKKAITRWNSYKYRFVPWMKFKIGSTPSTRLTDIGSDKIISDTEVLNQVTKTLTNLHRGNKTSVETCGFLLDIRKSTIEGAGRGVFVTEGAVEKGTVVAFYPGTVYLPYESIFFQSIGNPFIFKCSDGILIDGKDRGISKTVFKSCAGRDRVGSYRSADESWLNSSECKSFLNIGQIVNNQSISIPANVCYQEFDFPVDFAIELKQYIPNVFYQGAGAHCEMRTVVLVSTRQIKVGEELFSSYYTVIKS